MTTFTKVETLCFWRTFTLLLIIKMFSIHIKNGSFIDTKSSRAYRQLLRRYTAELQPTFVIYGRSQQCLLQIGVTPLGE